MAEIVYAKSKYVRRSPRKVRLVVDMVRGMEVSKALDYLKFTNKAASLDVYKVVKSAMANATFNKEMDKKELIIVDAFVNEAPTYKRGKAVARGRYHRIFRRNSHIIIGVSDDKDAMNNTKAVKKEVSTVNKKEEKKSDTKKKEVKKAEKKETKSKKTETKSKSKSKKK